LTHTQIHTHSLSLCDLLVGDEGPNLTNVTAVTDKFNASTYLLDPDFKALDAAGCVSPSLPHYSSFADICVDLLRQNS